MFSTPFSSVVLPLALARQAARRQISRISHCGAGVRLANVGSGNAQDAPARVAEFAQRRQLPFDVVTDNMGAIAAALGDVRATPTAFLIGADGRIIQRHVGEINHEALRGQIDKLLAAT